MAVEYFGATDTSGGEIDSNGGLSQLIVGIYDGTSKELVAQGTSIITVSGTAGWQGHQSQSAVKAAGGSSPGQLVGGNSYIIAFNISNFMFRTGKTYTCPGSGTYNIQSLEHYCIYQSWSFYHYGDGGAGGTPYDQYAENDISSTMVTDLDSLSWNDVRNDQGRYAMRCGVESATTLTQHSFPPHLLNPRRSFQHLLVR